MSATAMPGLISSPRMSWPDSSAASRSGPEDHSGATIPGIGGVFDVTDSLILTAPVSYWVFSLL